MGFKPLDMPHAPRRERKSRPHRSRHASTSRHNERENAVLVAFSCGRLSRRMRNPVGALNESTYGNDIASSRRVLLRVRMTQITGVNAIVQFVFQLAPSSAENVWSHAGLPSALILQMKRTSIGTPSTSCRAQKCSSDRKNCQSSARQVDAVCVDPATRLPTGSSECRTSGKQRSARLLAGSAECCPRDSRDHPGILRVDESPLNSVHSAQPVRREFKRRWHTCRPPMINRNRMEQSNDWRS